MQYGRAILHDMSLTKVTALAALVLLVVLGAGLVFAGMPHQHTVTVPNRHVTDAVYHHAPAPVRHI